MWRAVRALLSATFSIGNPAGQTYGGAFSSYTHTAYTLCTAYPGYSGPGQFEPITLETAVEPCP